MKKVVKYVLALTLFLSSASLLGIGNETAYAATASSRSLVSSTLQTKINSVGKQAKSSQACACFAYAYAQTMTTEKVHYWTEYDSNGGKSQTTAVGKSMTSYFTYTTTSSNQQSTLKALYDAINANKPCILWVTQKSGVQHWVTIVGYKNVTSSSSLSLSNFLMLDPVNGASSSPELLNVRGYTLRYGSNNVRVSKTTVASKHVTTSSTSTTSYYAKYTGSSSSIVDGLNAIGVDSSYANRTKIAAANGISNYTGTSAQNTQLLNLLKAGSLKKP